jgi:hypothetical protein
VDFGKIADDHLEIFHEGFEKDSHGRVMLHGGPTKLKNNRGDKTLLCFGVVSPKLSILGKSRTTT